MTLTTYSLFPLVSSILPWPFAINHSAISAHVEIRDLHYPSVIVIPYARLTSPTAAAEYVAVEVMTYRLLIDAWHGRYSIVWS